MSLLIPTCSESVLIVVDVQPSFLKAIAGGESIRRRTEFLMRIAGLLGVPVLATVQNSSRMGGIEPALEPMLTEPAFEKMAFSCMGCAPFVSRLSGLERKWAILVGIETHICVSQTAHHLIDQEFEVAIGIDAVGARTADRHESGIARLRDVGTTVAHTEAIAYEWLHSAEHPRFREALEVVKAFA
ncbi:MAG TPA: isochorismatase family protein [Fimbriimonadaceae bacterium]|nr:isochorismatase family protein [Fimbriimonadaceae bacterium]